MLKQDGGNNDGQQLPTRHDSGKDDRSEMSNRIKDAHLADGGEKRHEHGMIPAVRVFKHERD